MKRYTAQTPDGDRLTGTAREIADWLQTQDWHFGQAGQAGARAWREEVARRAAIQTGQVIDRAAVEAEDPSAFLGALASAKLITLEDLGTLEEVGAEDTNE